MHSTRTSLIARENRIYFSMATRPHEAQGPIYVIKSNMPDKESVNRLSLENFEFNYLHEYLGDTRKVTRKTHLLNTRQEQLFLPEGHSSERNGRSRTEISGNYFHWWSKAQGTLYRELGNSITLIEFAVCEDDIDITSCFVLVQTNVGDHLGFFCSLCKGSTMLAIPKKKNTPDQEDLEFMFLLWDGINTKTMAGTNELFQVRLSPKETRN